MSGRHRFNPSMRTDDSVAPGVRRSRAPLIIGAGLAAVVVGIVVIALTLSTGVKDATDKASLSSAETQQLREFLADRGKQRDAERVAVQQQLDDQRAVLCAAISTLSASARPEARAILSKAASDLRCSALPRAAATVRPTGTAATPATPRPSSTSSSTKGGEAQPDAAGAPSVATPRPLSTTGTAPRSPATTPPRSTSPTPRPSPSPSSPEPTPSPRPSPSSPGLLDPVTAPVCNLLHVCL